MRAKIITQVNLEHAEPGRDPIVIMFDKVEKIVIEEGKLNIDYRRIGAENDKIQQLELPISELFEVTLDLF